MKMSVVVVGKGVLLFGIDNPGMIQAQWNKVLKQALRRCLWAWWEYFLPNHFRAGSKSKYPGAFEPRKRSTEARKFKKYGHSLPLVTYPEGQPPPGRATLEGFLRIPPMVTVTAHQGVARWRTGRVQAKYIREALAMSTNDEMVLAKLFKDIIIKLLNERDVQGVQNGPRRLGPDAPLTRTVRRKIA